MIVRTVAVVLLVLCTWASAYVWAQGAIDAYQFESDVQSKRYSALIDEFRCPKCLNTNLSGSDAPIAADLRRVVYGLVIEGRSDDEIRAFLQQRYGDFVLYDTPMRIDTIALWAVPIGLGLLAIIVIVMLVRRRRETVAGLDTDAQARLASLLSEREPQ